MDYLLEKIADSGYYQLEFIVLTDSPFADIV